MPELVELFVLYVQSYVPDWALRLFIRIGLYICLFHLQYSDNYPEIEFQFVQRQKEAAAAITAVAIANIGKNGEEREERGEESGEERGEERGGGRNGDERKGEEEDEKNGGRVKHLSSSSSASSSYLHSTKKASSSNSAIAVDTEAANEQHYEVKSTLLVVTK